MLSCGQTRWCSLLEAVTRLLEEWDTLKDYFNDSDDQDDKNLSKSLIQEHKIYLQFLNIFLQEIARLNLLFQREVSQIPIIRTKITDFYEYIIHLLLKPEMKQISFEEKLKSINKTPKKMIFDIEEKFA